MPGQPYVVLSCAMSADGCLDTAGEGRLVLSGPADADRVDAERAAADALMVGAGTVRRDNPRLAVRSPQRRAARAARGLPEDPHRVTLTASGDLDPGARFFAGPPATRRLVYCPAPLVPGLQRRLDGVAQVIGLGPPVALAALLADLGEAGVGRLLVEGGADLGRQLLAGGLVDELQLAVAPFFVGEEAAPRFAGPGSYPHGPARPMRVAEVRQLDEMVVVRYLLDSGTAGQDGTDGEGGPGGEGGPSGHGGTGAAR